jgi:UDP-N-acetyl-2-amino-2-deoxyglucuronate dehydrogenase
MNRFALIGLAGYIAPRHLKAIKETGNNLVAALDKFDSVGILDSYFPKADFFTEFERFDRHVDKLRRKNEKIDFVSICTPNYLHDAHIRFALRNQSDAICEKPLVLNPWNVDALMKIEKETGKKVHNILQLRLHDSLMALKDRVDNETNGRIYDVDLTYITARGNWYFRSWKGDLEKSGGIATNIGIHFFDVLSWIFGDVKESIVHLSKPTMAAGFLHLEKARIRWFLSVDASTLPSEISENDGYSYRSIKIDGQKIDLDAGFSDLHIKSYQHILSGLGVGLQEAKIGVEMVYQIRNANPIGLSGDYHPIIKKNI